jgi:hypothetical protein
MLQANGFSPSAWKYVGIILKMCNSVKTRKKAVKDKQDR